MNPEFGKLWFRVAMFLTLLGLIALPFQERDSAGFYVTICTVGVGLLFIALIVVIIRRSQ